MAKHADKVITAADLRRMLRVRYPENAYALFYEVHNGTGGQHRRSADAVAMALWPSRGLEVIGFEFKVSRRDWLAEKNRPEKADAVGRFCDRWFLVISDDAVIAPDEVPKAWGVLVARGGKLVEAMEASLLKPEPLDRAFVAAMLRRAQSQLKSSVPKEDIDRQVQEAWSRGYEDGKRADAPRDETMLRANVERFEKATGVKLDSYNGEELGTAFAEYVADRKVLERARGRLRVLGNMAKHLLDEVQAQAAAIASEGGE